MIRTSPIDSFVGDPQDIDVKRLAALLLLLGVVCGLTVRPARALALPMAAMDMTSMAGAEMTAMPDCMASTAKDVAHKSCKCGIVGCIAMMASGASLMLADASPPLGTVIVGERQDHVAVVAALRGRSTAPEPEPPSAPI